MTTNKFLTPADVAERLSLTKQYVYILLKRGDIKSVKISPKAIRISEAQLAEFIESRSASK